MWQDGEPSVAELDSADHILELIVEDTRERGPFTTPAIARALAKTSLVFEPDDLVLLLATAIQRIVDQSPWTC
jgi:hypothetical protein